MLTKYIALWEFRDKGVGEKKNSTRQQIKSDNLVLVKKQSSYIVKCLLVLLTNKIVSHCLKLFLQLLVSTPDPV